MGDGRCLSADDLAGELGELALIAVRQRRQQRSELGIHLAGEPRRELSPFGGQAHMHRAAIGVSCGSGDQSATLGAGNQTADAGLLEREVVSKVAHRWLAIAQDAQQPRLRDGELMARGHPRKHILNRERNLYQRVQHPSIDEGSACRLTGRHGGGSLLDFVRIRN
jgi:hypothetical protein